MFPTCKNLETDNPIGLQIDKWLEIWTDLATGQRSKKVSLNERTLVDRFLHFVIVVFNRFMSLCTSKVQGAVDALNELFRIPCSRFLTVRTEIEEAKADECTEREIVNFAPGWRTRCATRWLRSR